MISVANAHIWLLLISGLVPLFTYVLNHYAPWADERTKGIVLVVVAGVVGGLYKAIDSGGFGWNRSTLTYAAVGATAALVSHHIILKPAGFSASLGGGTNAPAGASSVPALK